LNVWRQIENPTPSIDAYLQYLRDKQSSQVHLAIRFETTEP